MEADNDADVTPANEPGTVTDEADDELDDDEVDAGNYRTPAWIFPVIAAVLVIGFGVATFLVLRGSDSTAAVGPEGVPIQNVPDLASPKSTVDGTPVNGITCRSSMGQDVDHHIHQHIRIFVDGEQKRIPAGVGIHGTPWTQDIDGGRFVNNSAKGCVYWLHSHADDGIIHVESPSKRTFTLGDFFDVWNQPLSETQVGPAEGPVVAFLDGKRIGDPRDVPLTDGGVIQLNVGEPVVPFEPMDFTVENVCGDGTLSCSPEPGS
ncbi:MAG TPA: hypothetical protein VFN21_06845 [Acidimicrobiales bacterium]|nr:hypothetical protein [Acidimicrobiales bacterium]